MDIFNVMALWYLYSRSLGYNETKQHEKHSSTAWHTVFGSHAFQWKYTFLMPRWETIKPYNSTYICGRLRYSVKHTFTIKPFLLLALPSFAVLSIAHMYHVGSTIWPWANLKTINIPNSMPDCTTMCFQITCLGLVEYFIHFASLTFILLRHRVYWFNETAKWTTSGLRSLKASGGWYDPFSQVEKLHIGIIDPFSCVLWFSDSYQRFWLASEGEKQGNFSPNVQLMTKGAFVIATVIVSIVVSRFKF